MKCDNIPLCVLLFVRVVQISSGSRILGIFTAPSKSHLVIHMAIVDSLAARGHNLTVITTNSIQKKNKSFRHIQVADVPQMPHSAIPGIVKSLPSSLATLLTLEKMSEALAPLHNNSLHHPEVRDLMENESFDLVILGYFFNDFQLGIAAHFKCPVVVSWTVKPVRLAANLVGQPMELLYVPTLFSELKQPMGYFDRMKNIIYYALEVYFGYKMNQVMEKYYLSSFPSDRYPSLAEMRKNVSLLLVGHHFSEGPVFPTVPNIIEIGGIQAKEKPDKLPTDVQKFLDDGNEGVIFFSFGTNFPTTKLMPSTVETIYNVFSKLKQRVLLKWDSDRLPGNASNILLKSWLSQDDILAHPNTKLFVTHGGKGSIAETQYHAVPIVGIPLFGDQFLNIKTVVDAGFGVRVEFKDLSESTLRSAITEVLENRKYRQNLENYSKIYRDRPLSARDTATYWIEYVIRHRGAKHLQSPVINMNFIQYYGLDVMGTMMIIIYCVYKIFMISIKAVGRRLKKKKNKKSKTA